MSDTATAAPSIKVYGSYRFEVMEAPLEFDDGVAWLRLSRAGWTPCTSGDEAGLRDGFLDVHEAIDNRSEDDLPCGFGLIADREGNIIGVVTDEGSRRVQLLDPNGALAQVPARMAMFSLAQDESFDGRPFTHAAADYWAMGRPS